MNIRDEYFTGTISQEFFDCIAGDRIGFGSTRSVYAFRKVLGLDHVVKFEFGTREFQNTREWLVWNSWKKTKSVAKWLAPCISISPCGCVLIQARTHPMRPEDYPKKIPQWATDLKKENWGMYKGRPVIHDYGYIVTRLATGKNVKAKWGADALG